MIGRNAVVSFAFTAAVIVLALPAVATGQERSAVEGKLGKSLLERLEGTLGSGDGVPGMLMRVGRIDSKEDREVARKLKRAKITVEGQELGLQEALELICGAAKIPTSFSDGLEKTAAERGSTTNIDFENTPLADAMKHVHDGHPFLAWSIAAGTLNFMTSDERDEEREARRELLESLIEEIAGEDARILGDRYLLLYVGRSEESAEARRIREMLGVKRITVNFEETAFRLVVAFLRDVTGINMVTSPGVEDLGELPIDLKLKDIRLGSLINLLVDATGSGVEWTIRNDVIYFRTEEEAEKVKDADRSFVLIDISDLLFVPPDFPAPKLGLEGLERDD